MLKIREDVDFKELEKYGFETGYYDYYTTKKTVVIPCYCYECECSEEDTGHNKIYENQINFMVDKKTRIINRMTYGGKNSYYFNILQNQDYDLLYDLIKADLVVKVEE